MPTTKNKKTTPKGSDTRSVENEQYKSIFNSVADLIFVLSPTGKVIDANKTTLQATGYKKAEVLGKSITKIGVLNPKDAPKIIKRLAQIARGKRLKPLEWEITTKKGKKILKA